MLSSLHVGCAGLGRGGASLSLADSRDTTLRVAHVPCRELQVQARASYLHHVTLLSATFVASPLASPTVAALSTLYPDRRRPS